MWISWNHTESFVMASNFFPPSHQVIDAAGLAPVVLHQSSAFLPTERGCSCDNISIVRGFTEKKGCVLVIYE